MKEVKENTWFGRSLQNYCSMHPKANGAKTLTQARDMAFGKKTKNYGCRCLQSSCKRSSGKGGDSC